MAWRNVIFNVLNGAESEDYRNCRIAIEVDAEDEANAVFKARNIICCKSDIKLDSVYDVEPPE